MFNNLFKIEIKFSESHLVVPKIIIAVLIVTGAWILISYLYNLKKQNKQLKFNFKFFKENYDKLKFYGTLALLFGYVASLELIGFLFSSIIFMFIATMFFIGNHKPKTILTSALTSVITSVTVWYVFGTVFNITLP